LIFLSTGRRFHRRRRAWQLPKASGVRQWSESISDDGRHDRHL